MKKGLKPRELTLLGLLTALLIVMSCTPLGYLNIGPLAITFNVIPVAIAAIALGPTGGAIVGAVFGITSFLQAMGIGGASTMGIITFEISPLLTFVQRFVTRVLVGLLTGLIYVGLRKTPLKKVSIFITLVNAGTTEETMPPSKEIPAQPLSSRTVLMRTAYSRAVELRLVESRSTNLISLFSKQPITTLLLPISAARTI